MTLKRLAIFVHRWLGVALCVVFLIWFPSGIGIMYWDFPAVSAADRLERSPALDRSKILLSPVEAHARLGTLPPPTAVRLNTFDGRPVYRFRVGRGETLVYADTGDEQVEVSRQMMQRIASGWTGQPASAARVTPVEDVDQWTVQAPLRTLRPMWKYSWPNGEQVYVAETSGEVVQYTTTASRIGAYLGPIPHWLYFTPLRQRQLLWSRFVIWSSGIGTISAILGLVVAVWVYSPLKRYRWAGAPTSIPYRGQKRWHMVFGLIFGLGAVTWGFSGMLSMDPFPSRPAGRPAGGRGGGIPQALGERAPMAAFAAKDPREALAQLRDLDVKELEFTAFAGEPVYMATLAHGDTRIIPVAGDPRTEFDRQRILDVVTTAAQPNRLAETRLLDQYDRYYLDRRRQSPLPVLLVRVNDAEKSRYYIDPKTARVVGSYSSRNWVSRWAYHGLHSLDFPWLYNYRPLWDIVVITFMVGGTALCITSLILAWRVVGRKLARVLWEPAGSNPPDEGDDCQAQRGFDVKGSGSILELAVKQTLILATIAAVVASGLTASAHHPFAEVYVEGREVTIEGDVVRWEYRNPHSFVHIVAMNARNERVQWIVECRAASQLRPLGVTERTFRPGQRVIVTGSPGRVSADRRLRLRTVVRPQDSWSWRDARD